MPAPFGSGFTHDSSIATVVTLAGLAGPQPATADDAADCIGPDPAAGIPACTHVINAAASAEAVADAFVARAKHRVLVNDLAAALTDIDEALRRDPSNADAHPNRGVVYGIQGRFDEALAALDEGIRLSPATPAESPDALSSRSVLYLATHRLQRRAHVCSFAWRRANESGFEESPARGR
jgi:tetratricopeptide (TPR) repeat protein